MNTSIDRLLAYQMDAGHYAGACVHVERDGQVLARKVAGRLRPEGDEPMHEDALFRIASLTKPVVTVAALMQVDEGRLALVRAERSGGGKGRTYTFTVETKDAVGNTATSSVAVFVPHDQGK